MMQKSSVTPFRSRGGQRLVLVRGGNIPHPLIPSTPPTPTFIPPFPFRPHPLLPLHCYDDARSIFPPFLLGPFLSQIQTSCPCIVWNRYCIVNRLNFCFVPMTECQIMWKLGIGTGLMLDTDHVYWRVFRSRICRMLTD
jgi:hypothetical protein